MIKVHIHNKKNFTSHVALIWSYIWTFILDSHAQTSLHNITAVPDAGRTESSYTLCRGLLEIGDNIRITFLYMHSSKLKKASEPSNWVAICAQVKFLCRVIPSRRWLSGMVLSINFLKGFGSLFYLLESCPNSHYACCWWFLDRGLGGQKVNEDMLKWSMPLMGTCLLLSCCELWIFLMGCP